MNIVIVDDDKIVSMSLKTILEANGDINVLAVGEDGEDAIELYDQYAPDVLLMDIRMQRVNGIEASQKILAKHPKAKILLLTTFSDDEYITSAFEAGVCGYILKQDFEGILPAIRAVEQGQNVFGGKIIDKLPKLISSSKVFEYESFGITDKEFEIVKLVAQGLSNKEISETTFLSEGTVRNYLSQILEKLELRDRTQLAIFYYQNGGK